MFNKKKNKIFLIFITPKSKYMNAKTTNLLGILAAFGMIAAGITTLYDEEKLLIAVGLYFISKGFFVVSLMQKMHQNI
jgi:uncharacterized membrane protein